MYVYARVWVWVRVWVFVCMHACVCGCECARVNLVPAVKGHYSLMQG